MWWIRWKTRWWVGKNRDVRRSRGWWRCWGRLIRENTFIEANMPSDVNPISGRVKTAIAMVSMAVTKKNTRSRAEFNFVTIVRTKIRKGLTAKDS